MGSRCTRRTAGFASVMLVSFAMASAAAAFPLAFVVDPLQSRVSLAASTSLTFGFPPPLGLSTAAIKAQQQAGGVLGGTLPGGSTSDGLETALSGSIAAELVPGSTLAFDPLGTSVVPLPSGIWRPGLPAEPNLPASAQLAASFRAAVLGLVVSVAIRDAVLTLGPGGGALSPIGAGSFEIGGPFSVSLRSGLLDYTANAAGVGGRVALHAVAVSAPGNGQLDDLGGGAWRLTLPLSVAVLVPAAAFDGLLPVNSLSLSFEGQIVADAVVPEPASALLLGAGLATLARMRRGAVRGDPRW